MDDSIAQVFHFILVPPQ